MRRAEGGALLDNRLRVNTDSSGRPPTPRDSADVVLVVGDEQKVIEFLQAAFDEAGYTVLVARSSPDALALAAQAGPDIVLLDAAMPRLDGYEIARRLQADARTSAIPIVFMAAPTASAQAAQRVAAFAAGGIDCLTQPIRQHELLARIAAHLQRTRAQREARHALDAFGHATLVVRERDGRRLWQTALARSLLEQHFGGKSTSTPPELIAWVARESLRRRAGAEPHSLTVARGTRRLTFALHALPEHSSDAAAGGEWLIVMRGSDDGAIVEAIGLSLAITAREAEVLYWVVQGKTEHEIGAALGTSVQRVARHLEQICGKLGVETRAAAVALALARVKALARA
jgi:DNA-binding response OmpR family regulator/DNA-binding CsgD family transcriptional regulator